MALDASYLRFVCDAPENTTFCGVLHRMMLRIANNLQRG
jgi:hypothetical protein